MNVNSYCEAKFAWGTGLGNRLFPWARCKIFSKLNGVPMLTPWWVQPRIGPLLRGGIDLRAYHRQILLFGLFSTSGNYVNGLKTLLISAKAVRRAEPDELKACEVPQDVSPVIFSFAGDKQWFMNLEGWREYVYGELKQETRRKWVELAEENMAPIALNIRCGNDFREANGSIDYSSCGAYKTPLQWFVDSLKSVRRICGANIPAVVVSDGSYEQLSTLLQLPNVNFARPGCAISDLLTLAQASVLLISGNSSFSAWGSWLSNAITLTHPGQWLPCFRYEPENQRYVGEYDPNSEPSIKLVEQIRTACSKLSSQ